MWLTADLLTAICTGLIPLAAIITIFARYFAVDLWKGYRLDRQMQYHLLMTPAADWWEHTVAPKRLATAYLAHGGNPEICQEYLWRRRHYPFGEWCALSIPVTPFLVSAILGGSVHAFWKNLGF